MPSKDHKSYAACDNVEVRFEPSEYSSTVQYPIPSAESFTRKRISDSAPDAANCCIVPSHARSWTGGGAIGKDVEPIAIGIQVSSEITTADIDNSTF